jgi:electron transport complex protein RnfG
MAEMNQQTPQGMPPAAPEANSARMIVTMGAIGLIAGLLIVLTYQVTFPVIKRNKAEALERAVFEVIPGAGSKTTFLRDGDRLSVLEGEDDTARKYYAGYDDTGRLVGVAIEASGQGFQDIVRLLYGYSPECRCIVGMKVLESRETPGLGDKIMTDDQFKANFDALDVELTGDGAAVAHPIEMVKHGEKSQPWQVEAITGATISSRAVANILRASSAEAVPVIEENLGALGEGNP